MAHNEGHCPERFELADAGRELELGVDFFRTMILRISRAFWASSVSLTSTVRDCPPQPVTTGETAKRPARIMVRHRACLKTPTSALQPMISPRSLDQLGRSDVQAYSSCVMPHFAAKKAAAGAQAENAKLLDFEPRFQSPQGPAQMHRRRARSSRVDRLGIARPAQSVTRRVLVGLLTCKLG